MLTVIVDFLRSTNVNSVSYFVFLTVLNLITKSSAIYNRITLIADFLYVPRYIKLDTYLLNLDQLKLQVF